MLPFFDWHNLSIFATAMNEFVPHKIDTEESFESALLGDVKAGFPSPAEDIREKLDLIKLLVKHKASTFSRISSAGEGNPALTSPSR